MLVYDVDDSWAATFGTVKRWLGRYCVLLTHLFSVASLFLLLFWLYVFVC